MCDMSLKRRPIYIVIYDRCVTDFLFIDPSDRSYLAKYKSQRKSLFCHLLVSPPPGNAVEFPG